MKITNPPDVKNIQSSSTIEKSGGLKNTTVSKSAEPEAVDKVTQSSSNDPLTEDLISRLNEGEIDTKEAVTQLIDRLIEQSGVKNSKDMRTFMLDQIKNDPGLKILAGQMGINTDLL